MRIQTNHNFKPGMLVKRKTSLNTAYPAGTIGLLLRHSDTHVVSSEDELMWEVLIGSSVDTWAQFNFEEINNERS